MVKVVYFMFTGILPQLKIFKIKHLKRSKLKKKKKDFRHCKHSAACWDHKDWLATYRKGPADRRSAGVQNWERDHFPTKPVRQRLGIFLEERAMGGQVLSLWLTKKWTIGTVANEVDNACSNVVLRFCFKATRDHHCLRLQVAHCWSSKGTERFLNFIT